MIPTFIVRALLCLCCLALTACGAEPSTNSFPTRLEAKTQPAQPRSGEAVTINIQLPSRAENVVLEYQVVEPGAYIPLKDAAYRKGWNAVTMTAPDASNYSAVIPGSVQQNRRLIRYRIQATDASGKVKTAPARDDAEPNFAYFVYDGIPAWKGAIQPGSRDPRKSRVAEFPPDAMNQVQSYFLLARKKDVEDATWYRQSFDKEYPYTGALVANGVVYDHVRFRARGGVWRYAMGKNMWKFDFNKGHLLRAIDDYGLPYKSKWGKLNLRACIQQGDYGRRGEQGMYEAVGFRLFNLAGVEAPRTHWLTLRIVDEKEESPASQYQGDFWGLYLAIENEDGHFLEEHGLPDGNLYKIMGFQGDPGHVANGQSTDGSDVRRFIGALHRGQSDAWWRQNVDLPRYYSYRSIIEAIHHYDISDGKNYDFYLNPKNSRWSVVPWDIDLSWGDHMYGGGHEPFMHPVLSRAEFRLEYQNRLREIRDLLFNDEQTGQLIDECAAIISRRGSPSIVDADRAKWDYHPIMASRHSMSGKADQGRFYQSSPSGDFAGMVSEMKDYVRRRSSYIDSRLLDDQQAPGTPAIVYAGPSGYPLDQLSFRANHSGKTGQISGMKWRIAEIDAPKSSVKPDRPGHYEINAVWESAESKEEISVPPGKLRPGHTYRARVRIQDGAGRWSHWSAPVQFSPAQTN